MISRYRLPYLSDSYRGLTLKVPARHLVRSAFGGGISVAKFVFIAQKDTVLCTVFFYALPAALHPQRYLRPSQFSGFRLELLCHT